MKTNLRCLTGAICVEVCQVNCEAFGHVVMKFGGELYRFPAGDFCFFFVFPNRSPRRWEGGT